MLWVKDLTRFVEMPTATEDFSSCGAFWKTNFKNCMFFPLCTRSIFAGSCPDSTEVVKLVIRELKVGN